VGHLWNRLSANDPEAQDTGDNQKDRDNVVEQTRHNQDQDTGDQCDERLEVFNAYGHVSASW
jgi:hypothetical protein